MNKAHGSQKKQVYEVLVLYVQLFTLEQGWFTHESILVESMQQAEKIIPERVRMAKALNPMPKLIRIKLQNGKGRWLIHRLIDAEVEVWSGGNK